MAYQHEIVKVQLSQLNTKLLEFAGHVQQQMYICSRISHPTIQWNEIPFSEGKICCGAWV